MNYTVVINDYVTVAKSNYTFKFPVQQQKMESVLY